jgi:hypothetical protein
MGNEVQRVSENETEIDKQIRQQCAPGWYIPVWYQTSIDRGVENMHWMQPGQTHTINVDKSVEWVLMNRQANAMYRTQYDETNWNALIKQMKVDHTV